MFCGSPKNQTKPPSVVKLNYFQYLETTRDILSPSLQLPTACKNMACGLTRSSTIALGNLCNSQELEVLINSAIWNLLQNLNLLGVVQIKGIYTDFYKAWDETVIFTLGDDVTMNRLTKRRWLI